VCVRVCAWMWFAQCVLEWKMPCASAWGGCNVWLWNVMCRRRVRLLHVCVCVNGRALCLSSPGKVLCHYGLPDMEGGRLDFQLFTTA
jgi:hypothetical protein